MRPAANETINLKAVLECDQRRSADFIIDIIDATFELIERVAVELDGDHEISKLARCEKLESLVASTVLCGRPLRFAMIKLFASSGSSMSRRPLEEYRRMLSVNVKYVDEVIRRLGGRRKELAGKELT